MSLRARSDILAHCSEDRLRPCVRSEEAAARVGTVALPAPVRPVREEQMSALASTRSHNPSLLGYQSASRLRFGGMDEPELRLVLSRLDLRARDAVRRILIADDMYRSRMAERLLRQRTEHATNLADLIDMLTIDADARRHVIRLLGELEAT